MGGYVPECLLNLPIEVKEQGCREGHHISPTLCLAREAIPTGALVYLLVKDDPFRYGDVPPVAILHHLLDHPFNLLDDGRFIDQDDGCLLLVNEDVGPVVPVLVADEEAVVGCFEEGVRVNSIVVVINILP